MVIKMVVRPIAKLSENLDQVQAGGFAVASSAVDDAVLVQLAVWAGVAAFNANDLGLGCC
jgi:hypothetical protein